MAMKDGAIWTEAIHTCMYIHSDKASTNVFHTQAHVEVLYVDLLSDGYIHY